MTAERSDPATRWKLSNGAVLTIAQKMLAQGSEVFRCHARFLPNGTEQESWFYAPGSGRFDLPSPHGTLNVAEEEAGAVLESFGSLLVGRSWVRSEEVDRRKLVALRLPSTVALADLRSSSALKAGVVPGELTGGYGSYELTQSLAQSVFSAGRDGIASSLRFGSAFRQDGFYIFGAAGVHSLSNGRALSLSATLNDLGYDIVNPPASDAITLLD